MDEKRFRLDFVIAFCALLISTIAAGASVYQTRVIARQFSATVWPYVTFDSTYSPAMLEFDLHNEGLGPAIVRGVTITFDGKPQPSLEALLKTIARREPRAVIALRAAVRAGTKMAISTSTPKAGMVIPANTQRMLLRMDGALLVRYFQPQVQGFGLSLCYCSLTGDCWTQRFVDADSAPASVASCPRHG
jgi:hypothetical protein